MEKEALEKIIRKLEARRSAYDAAIEDLLYLKDKKGHHLSNSAGTRSASNSEVNCKEFHSVLPKRFISE